MPDVLDQGEAKEEPQVVREAEAVIRDTAAPTKLTADEVVAYWSYLKRWREAASVRSSRDGRGSADAPFPHDRLAHVLAAERSRREIVTKLRRRRKPDPELSAALAGTNRYLLLEPQDRDIPSWAKYMEKK